MLLDEVRRKAREAKDRIFADPHATESDKEYIALFLKILNQENLFLDVPGSTMQVALAYIGYPIDQVYALYCVLRDSAAPGKVPGRSCESSSGYRGLCPGVYGI